MSSEYFGLIYIGLRIYFGLKAVASEIAKAIAQRPVVVTHEHHIYALSKDGWVKFNPENSSWSVINNPPYKLIDKE